MAVRQGRQLVGRRDDKDKDTVGEMEWMVARGSGDRLEQGTKLEKWGGGAFILQTPLCIQRPSTEEGFQQQKANKVR